MRILAPAFFDPQGERVFRGGAERYLVELARVVERLGFPVEVFQPAAEPWVRETDGLRVHGLAVEGYAGLDRAVLAAAGSRPLLTIHLAFYTAGPDTPGPPSASATASTGTTPPRGPRRSSAGTAPRRWSRCRIWIWRSRWTPTRSTGWRRTRRGWRSGWSTSPTSSTSRVPARPARGGPLTFLFPRRLVAARRLLAGGRDPPPICWRTIPGSRSTSSARPPARKRRRSAGWWRSPPGASTGARCAGADAGGIRGGGRGAHPHLAARGDLALGPGGQAPAGR